MVAMRTTLSLEDDVFQEVKRVARSRSMALGKVVSHLVRRGLAARSAIRKVNGLQVFDLPARSPRVTAEQIHRLEDES